MAVWWQTLVAALGGVVGLALFLSPSKAVLRARSERVLGDLNPLPFTTLTANCVGWVAYSFVTDDALVYWPNALGFLLGMFYTFSCYGLADTKTRDRQLAIVLFFSVVLMVVGAVGTLGDLSQDDLKLLWGYTSNAILLLFYSSPLSTILLVLRTRNSSSLQLPLSVMNIINGSLWLVYGIAISDLFIAVPNGVGAVLGVVYCILICMFPRRIPKRSPASSDTGTNTSRRELVGRADSDLAGPGSKLAGAAAAQPSLNGPGSIPAPV